MRIQASLIAFALLASSEVSFGQTMNSLTAQEKTQGWQLLFDGKTLIGWHPSAPPPARGQGQGRAGARAAWRAPGGWIEANALRHRVKDIRTGRCVALGSRGRSADTMR
jgi:hypothetical protein